ncbi:TRADD-N-associated membrane domain-containing protein [Streptomyces mirabilis]|uniref:TRADD-N-associated membrane domain-containing protein n=1 Tax=Streptomyces mirabilis TaxID=68239 RepID=UPI00224EB2B4|nr:hypothetical protein [Streptomyces mirabilis]MCX4608718.1 hypothetical protein [Streptomyces mirabilis]
MGALSSGGLAIKGFTRAVDRERAELTEELLPEDTGVEYPTPEEKDSAKFTKLLIRYYSYGLTQARASFYVSLFASIIGGAVLITGIGLAIYRADTIGDQYASIVSSVAGLLTVAIGSLFHKRADSALQHMESQSRGLREDMKAQSDLDKAIELLGQEKDATIKAHLRAALVIKLSNSSLPELPKVVPAPRMDNESSSS